MGGRPPDETGEIGRLTALSLPDSPWDAGSPPIPTARPSARLVSRESSRDCRDDLARTGGEQCDGTHWLDPRRPHRFLGRGRGLPGRCRLRLPVAVLQFCDSNPGEIR